MPEERLRVRHHLFDPALRVGRPADAVVEGAVVAEPDGEDVRRRDGRAVTAIAESQVDCMLTRGRREGPTATATGLG